MNDLYTYPNSQPLKLARITSPKSPPDELSQRTRKRRIHEVQNIRSIIGVNSKGSELILGDEILQGTECGKETGITSQCWGPNGNATNARACNKMHASHPMVQTENPP